MDIPPSIVIKLPPKNNRLAKLSMKFDSYRKEICFYREIGLDAGIDVPNCYLAEIDAQSGDFILALEDLKKYEQILVRKYYRYTNKKWNP